MSQTFIRHTLCGDAIDRALVPGPRKTGIRRLYLVDLLVGYALGSEWRRGWWRQRAFRLYGPHRTWKPYLWTRNGCSAEDADEVAADDDKPYDPRWVRLFEVHPSLRAAQWMGGDEWKTGDRSKYRRIAVSLAWGRIRDRLFDETGYRQINAPEEAADAARVYSSKPKSIGYRALMTLVDNPIVWTDRRAA